MIKKTALGIAAAAAITVTALSGTASTAQAGNFVFEVHGPGWGWSPGYHGFHGHYGWRNPCRHWKRKFNRTGRRYFLRRYNRCMRHYF